jgi:hypothetical protein
MQGGSDLFSATTFVCQPETSSRKSILLDLRLIKLEPQIRRVCLQKLLP